MKQIAILGAGLTGLSAAYHLGDRYDIFEQETEAGGLCRTMKRHGFLFDYTGHLLHLRHAYTKALIQRLFPHTYTRHVRKAYIYVQNSSVKYPFQANIHGLAPEIVKECILGFVETLSQQPRHATAAPNSFKEWVLQTFGKGIARYFMFPYNLKLWRTPLEELSADWVSWSIPKPSLEEFLNGALGIINRDFGYNPTFLYPKTGGIGQLPDTLVSHLPSDRLHYQKTAVAIDIEEQIIRFNDNSIYHYDQLISTIPLKHLVSILQHVPESITRAGEQLRYISVYDVNIGINRPNISEKHWIYFPEPKYIFYRVGFPSNFSNEVTPAGCSSLYVEVSSLPEQEIAEQILLADIYKGLQQCGLLQASDEILVRDVVRIDCAYVIHDRNRARALESILPYLQQKNIYSLGRYGSWEYSSMEDAILSGKQIADTLRVA